MIEIILTLLAEHSTWFVNLTNPLLYLACAQTKTPIADANYASKDRCLITRNTTAELSEANPNRIHDLHFSIEAGIQYNKC